MKLDQWITEFDKILRTLAGVPMAAREVPGGTEQAVGSENLSDEARAHAGALMRVNHVGEVCAQALYQGQALTCRNVELRTALEHAAKEEVDHLDWTRRRVAELGTRTSRLNPVWYAGALSIGLVAGKLGDGWNLGFLAETERQVEAHLDAHLHRLPASDSRSRAIVQQMKQDEGEHAKLAERLGARELPAPVRLAMRVAAKVMTATAYRL